MVIALTARLVPNLVLPMGAAYDIQSYQVVGNLVLQGKDVYSSPEAEGRHPYLPLQLYWMAASQRITEQFHLDFVKIVRLVPILTDVGIALALYFFLLRSFSPDLAFTGGLLYAVNPVTVLVSAYHGQFDALPALFTLLALYWLESSHCPKNAIIAGSWLGLGVLVKSWPVLALPSLMAGNRSWTRRMIFLASTILIPCLGTALYLLITKSNLFFMLSQVLGYNHGIGVWGYTYFFRLLSLVQPAHKAVYSWFIEYGRWITLAVLAIIWYRVIVRKESPHYGVLIVLVSFLAITHAFSIQYLMWVVPFAILCQHNQWLRRYTLAAFAYMFLAYNTLILELHITKLLPWPQADWLMIIPFGLPAWLVCIGWAKGLLFPNINDARETTPSH